MVWLYLVAGTLNYTWFSNKMPIQYLYDIQPIALAEQ